MPLTVNPAATEAELTALLTVDFDWVKRLNEVWSDSTTDVAELHSQQRANLRERLTGLSSSGESQESQLIVAYVGNPGSGKTHFLSFVRREALARGMHFVLVDMTDVRDFWSTVSLGYLESLGRQAVGSCTQLQMVLCKVVALSSLDSIPEEAIEKMAKQPPAELSKTVQHVLSGLHRSGRVAFKDLSAHQDVIRALFFLNSQDFETCSAAHTWLQGIELDEVDAHQLGIKAFSQSHSSILKGLSWVMSLRAPTVLAFDQLDAIVTQHDLAAASSDSVEPNEEQKTALAIIEGIVGGLSAVVDTTIRTFPIVTTLNTTMDALKRRGLKAHNDRFQETYKLSATPSDDVARAIVERRLSDAYHLARFSPPYPTWPFRPECFRGLQGGFPRQILQRCAEHKKRCATMNSVVEIMELPTSGESTGSDSKGLIKTWRFDQMLEQAPAHPLLLAEDQEDEFGALILRGCELLLKESSAPSDIDLLLDSDFAGTKSFPSLHARIRSVYHNERDREEHTCLRVLQRSNPQAYKARLCAAMTAAGIDRGLSFRKLMIIRTAPRPITPKMAELTDQFEKRGGVLLGVSETDAAKLKLLADLSNSKDPEFDAWLRERKPVSRLAFFGQLVSRHCEEVNEKAAVAEKQKASSPTTSSPAPIAQPRPATDGVLLVGRRLISGKPDEVVTLSPRVLSRHTVIRAGSGGGKTVLLKRLVEEAAVSGIPSILIDAANDLAQIGDAWPADPEHWIPGDAERARRYHRQTEIVIWTPGRSAGRPLQLAPLPDFAAAAEDEDQLNSAVDMALGTLEQYVAPGTSETARKKKGVLAGAMRYFARHGGGGIEALIGFLSDMPVEAGGGISSSPRIAGSVADSLRAAVQTEPLLQTGADTVDPGLLFGLGTERTRISVINLIGLCTPSAQQNFVNQLAMALFSWIKKHPSVGLHGLTGLFVVDEAKDFLPSVSTTPCKQNLMLLAAQARKYGLGLILATQNPKDLDYRAVAQFSTQFFGQAHSPQVIEFIQRLVAEKGGGGDDVGRLQKGQFYFISEGIQAPIKLAVPICLSYHPDGRPLTEAEILAKARNGASLLGL